MSRSEIQSAEKDMVGEIWTSKEPYRNLRTFCDRFGPRFPGTEGEKGGRDFLLDKMREYGLEKVQTEEFEYLGWIRGTAQLEVTSPVRQSFPCISLPHCGTDDVEAELLFLGYGIPQDFESRQDEIAGKIVMMMPEAPSYFGRYLHRIEKYGRAVAAGAKGFIWMRGGAGDLIETGCLRYNKLGEIPGIGVSRETGETLARWLHDGNTVRLRMKTENVSRPMKSWNIVGQVSGSRCLDRQMVVGAHWDAHDLGQGASDSGASAMALLELGRVFAKHRDAIDRTLRLVCFGAEDIGITGSLAYVKQHASELDKIDFMLNLDGTGRWGDQGFMTGGAVEIIPRLKKALWDMEEAIPVADLTIPEGDQFPFFLAGVPATIVWSLKEGHRGYGMSHTTADTLDKVLPEVLRRHTMLYARLLIRLLNEPDWPQRERSADRVKEYLTRYDMMEPIRHQRSDNFFAEIWGASPF